MAKQRALFLDRDGTLIRDSHYLKNPQEVEIIEVVGPALQLARDEGFLLFMHSNQSGIARGYYDWPDVYACNEKMYRDFGWVDDFFTEVCIAPESPDETEGYRKPSSKFEEEMIKKYDLEPSQCWVIGDKWIDPETAINAGMRGVLVRTGKSIDQSLEEKAAFLKIKIFENLAEFIRIELNL
jgi:D-glycero-D-manno-heptose 1,7-bisphosphate phosphatase